uniref:LRAT domain-containing protein n=2 Tax=Macrostomum lignano TaxID=282301 RepID=A0A1I8GNP3_9PLAT
MHRSVSDSATLLSHPHQSLRPASQRYFICLCGNLDPEKFVKIERFNPARDSIANTFVRVCKCCEFPVAEREGYAYCPMCNHELPGSFRRLNLQPGNRLTLCLLCDSAVPTDRIENFFNLLDHQMAQLESVADASPAADFQCPQCCTGRLKFSLELAGPQQPLVEASASALKLMAACSACEAVFALLDETSSPAATGAAQNGCQGDAEAIDTSLDSIVAPYLCDRCPGASFDRLHPVDHRRGGNSVSAAKASPALAAAEADSHYESLFCTGCQLAIPLYVSSQARGPATLAELRRVVAPRYSTGEAGLPHERQRITSVDQLSPGDHVCYPRQGGVYWHHGIVTSVDLEGKSYQVLHYSNYTEARSDTWQSWLQWLRIGRSKGVVREDRMDLAKEPETHRLVYHSLDCFSPEQVVWRARSQAKQANYHLIGENCEHLAVWSKSGEARSLQVEQIRQLCYRLGQHLLALRTKAAAATDTFVKLAAADSLTAVLKLRQSLADLIDRRISALVFSRRLWRALIRQAVVLATSTMLHLAVGSGPGRSAVEPIAKFLGGAVGDTVADMVLPAEAGSSPAAAISAN